MTHPLLQFKCSGLTSLWTLVLPSLLQLNHLAMIFCSDHPTAEKNSLLPQSCGEILLDKLFSKLLFLSQCSSLVNKSLIFLMTLMPNSTQLTQLPILLFQLSIKLNTTHYSSTHSFSCSYSMKSIQENWERRNTTFSTVSSTMHYS